MDFSQIPRYSNRKCACIVVPHPDDFEILNAHTALALIAANFQVYEILMSGGEYGIVNRFARTGDRIKGKILQKMRFIENRQSKQHYGTFSDGMPCVISLRMDYIDGFIPFTKKSVNRLKTVIQFLQPSIVIGPDPLYTTDLHSDHLATARNTFFAVKWLRKVDRPRYLFFFQSFHNNFGMRPQSWATVSSVNLAHRSQMAPLDIKIFIFCMRYLIFPFRRNRTILRKYPVSRFEDPNNWMDSIQNVKDWFLYGITLLAQRFIIQTTNLLYFPHPTELGLKIEPEDLHIPMN